VCRRQRQDNGDKQITRKHFNVASSRLNEYICNGCHLGDNLQAMQICMYKDKFLQFNPNHYMAFRLSTHNLTRGGRGWCSTENEEIVRDIGKRE
jgi:hypothetical protein